jgi:glycerophosphoryl diester phosphodiesterase
LIIETFRKNWKSYLGIHIAVNILSLAVLTPLATILIGWLILTSGQVALKDEDILFFALSPIGSIVLLLVAAIYTSIVIFQQAAMLLLSQQLAEGQTASLTHVARLLLNSAWPLFRLALQMIGRAALLATPFLALSALIYSQFLTEFDINYYLNYKPPVLWWTGALIGLCLLAMTGLLLRVFSGWMLALPLLLLDRETPAAALGKSQRSTVSYHLRIIVVLLGILLLNTGALGLVSWLVELGVNGAIGFAGDSLKMLAYLFGTLLVIWVVCNVAITFCSNTFLSLFILHYYERLIGAPHHRYKDRTEPQQQSSRKKHRFVARLTGLILIAGLVTGVVVNHQLDNLVLEDHSNIIAHRGASADAPENTLAAMELAIQQGADWVEIDVQETRDGEVVVLHDADLKKIGNSNFKVSESSLEELQSVDIGSWMDASFSDQRIPTLEQLLAFCKGRVKVFIELKYYGHEQHLEERVAKIVENAGMKDQVAVMSLSYAGIRKMKSIRPEWPVGLLSSIAIGDITRLEVDFFAINAQFAKRSFVKRVHRKNQKVLVWTVNDPVTMSAMMSRGVDGIITDKPGLAAKVMQERANLDLTERIIIQVASFVGRHPSRPEQ